MKTRYTTILMLCLFSSAAQAASFLGYSINLDGKEICSSGTTFMGRSIQDGWNSLPGSPLQDREGRIKPDKPGGNIASIKGAIAIRLRIRGNCVGIVELDTLELHRRKESWVISDAEYRRFSNKTVADDFVVITILKFGGRFAQRLNMMYKRPADPGHPLDYWALLKTPPLAATCDMDEALAAADQKTLQLKGKLEIRIHSDPHFAVGDHLELKELTFSRENTERPHWTLDKAEWARIKPAITYVDPEVVILVNAARKADFKTVKAQLDKGADINGEYLYSSALTAAIYRGDEKLFQYLLEREAKVDDEAICVAVDAGNMDFLKALRAKHPALPVGCLHIAAKNGQKDMAIYLLEQGAEVDALEHRLTALHEAITRDEVELVALLLANGADPHLRIVSVGGDRDGFNAMDLAKKTNAKKVIPLLRKAMKKSNL